MAKVICTNTCYMPQKDATDKVVERYEDEYGDERDIYDIPAKRVQEFLDTGNFVQVEK